MSNLDKPGVLWYKCRRCGEQFSGGTHTPKLFITLVDLMQKGTHYVPCAVVHETTTHSCKDNKGMGIADCIGGEFEE